MKRKASSTQGTIIETFFPEFQHLRIQLEDIKSATNNFDVKKVIGTGGFGKVYGGEVSHSKGWSMVAFKRLDRRFGQGDLEFWKEIMMLSRYTHQNLISILGFCDEDDEKILVYEHASNGSLDRYLSSPTFTWIQRLKTCLDAARGLSYLHDDKGTQQRVLHRDIKSSNILLDEFWNAKVSDMGLSKIGPANQLHTALVTNVVGTPGYLDPMYLEFHILTKESDVYSFGVVLFEVLCGRLCFESIDGKFSSLVRMWKQKYKQNKLDEIISQDLMQEMDPRSLETFSNIAFQCLQKYRERRPKMSLVVEKLKTALEFQEIFEEMKRPVDYENIIKTAIHPLTYNSEEELKSHLSNGILLNGGKTWFSLNKNGEHVEMISAAECVVPATPVDDDVYEKFSNFSRFPPSHWFFTDNGKFKAHVRTQFLSPQFTYTVNLVFKRRGEVFPSIESRYLCIRYRLEGEEGYSYSHLTDVREDGWLMAELYQFDSHTRNIDLEIFFEGSVSNGYPFLVQGIEFRPIEKVEHEVLEDDDGMQSISEPDETYWGNKLPDDYDDIIKWFEDDVIWTTKKELYSILCNGFLMSNSEVWFFLAKSGKRCIRVPAKAALIQGQWEFVEEAYDPTAQYLSIECEIKSEILSPETTYACYLVYTLADDSLHDLSALVYPFKVKDENFHDRSDGEGFQLIYLVNPEVPVIRPKADQNSYIPLNRPKLKGTPQRRDDGWMEVQVCDFQPSASIERQIMYVNLEPVFKTLTLELRGLTVQGIEFRPE